MLLQNNSYCKSAREEKEKKRKEKECRRSICTHRTKWIPICADSLIYLSSKIKMELIIWVHLTPNSWVSPQSQAYFPLLLSRRLHVIYSSSYDTSNSNMQCIIIKLMENKNLGCRYLVASKKWSNGEHKQDDRERKMLDIKILRVETHHNLFYCARIKSKICLR